MRVRKLYFRYLPAAQGVDIEDNQAVLAYAADWQAWCRDRIEQGHLDRIEVAKQRPDHARVMERFNEILVVRAVPSDPLIEATWKEDEEESSDG